MKTPGVDKVPTWNPTEHYKNPTVADSYDADRFSSFPAKIYITLEQRVLLKALGNVPYGSTVADIPCGTGRLAEVMLVAGYNVVGMDISSEMLKVAARRLAKYGDRFVTKIVDARTLTQDETHVDAVLCARVLMHFPLEEQIRFLDGVRQISDGPVILTQSFDSRYQRFRRRIKQILGHQQPAQYPIGAPEIDRLLRGARLKEISRFHLFPAICEAVIIVTEKL